MAFCERHGQDSDHISELCPLVNYTSPQAGSPAWIRDNPGQVIPAKPEDTPEAGVKVPEQVWEDSCPTPVVPPRECGAPRLPGDVGRKDDSNKLRYDLIPMLAEAEIVKALTYGAKKYGEYNWRAVPGAKKRYIAAAMRHLADYRGGQERDLETGIHHLAHAACCFLFMMELDLNKELPF